ncbi:uncharacterized protein PRCAT00001650001 [Priceomyces carsonii]|uniref:uncharacterized protein n=1 Tax=Priceomyces carsonii TaxID=28549 RepID=UPI002ED83CF7|nr:unnamed protein product [Priceomyces carsonii]
MTRSNSKNEKSFKFKKSIVATIKEPISTKELLVRLQTLSDELSAVDADSANLSEFTKILGDLVNGKLLGNSNMGVQAFVCCCISDILRINAPNAPYNATDLSLIFKAFFRQFRKLGDPETPYFQQQCYILKRLAEVRSIILITDLPDAEHLIELLFETLYHLSSKDFSRKLEPLAADILSEVIAEAEVIPTKVVKLVIEKFLTNDVESTTINSKGKITNPALAFSVQVCELNLDRMSRQIAQMFSEMLYESTEHSELTGKTASNHNFKNSKAFESLLKIHRLSIKIWKYVPELLSSIMALIDDELNAEDDLIRGLATETIGHIIGTNSIPGIVTTKVNFFISHKQIWANWLKKTTDISSYVRVKWVEQVPAVIACPSSSTSEISSSLSACLNKCLLDSDEKVRLAACRCVEKISFELFTYKICSRSIMSTLSHLTREKNADIRNYSIRIFGNIFDMYMRAKASNKIINFGLSKEEDSAELENLISHGIPNQILSLIYINDRSITAAVDSCLFEKLLPISESNSIARVERLTRLYFTLDDKGKQSFVAINKRQEKLAKVIKTYIDTSEKYNDTGDVLVDKENFNVAARTNEKDNVNDNVLLLLKMDKIIKWLCAALPDDHIAYICLERFFKLRKPRFLYLIRVCISPESDYNTVKNSLRELLTKLSDTKNFKLDGERSNISSTDMVATFKMLMFRASFLLYNKSNVIELITYAKDPDHKLHSTANELLEHISATVPDILKFHMSALTDLIISDTDKDTSSDSKSLNLKTIYHFIKRYPDLFSKDIKFTEKLKYLAIYGTPIEARYSIKILGLSDKRELYCSSIIDSIYPLDLQHKNFPTELAAMAELYLVDPLSVQDKSSDITSHLIKEIFLKNRPLNSIAIKSVGDWITDDELDDNFVSHATLYEKLLAIRILVNKLKSYDDDGDKNVGGDESLVEQAQPVLKLFVSIIGNRGEIINKKSPTWPTPEVYKLRIRLAAGLSLLKLSKRPTFNEMIYPTTIRRLTFLVADSNYRVRSNFLSKLQKNLVNETISERFLPIVFFTAIEQSEELKTNSTIWIKSLYNRSEAKSSIKFEKSLVRLIHIIAHHEQFLALIEGQGEGTEVDTEQKLTRAYTFALQFVAYFLTLIGKVENISLLYYFASRIKQHRDATVSAEIYDNSEGTEAATNLYRVSELTQLAVKEYSDQRGWPLQTWPGKLKLPSDIYTPISNARELQNIITKVYIPDKTQIELKGIIRKRFFGVNTKRRAVAEETYDKQKKPKVKSQRSNLKYRKSSRPKDATASKPIEKPSRKSSRVTKKLNYGEESDFESGNNESDSYIE